MDKFLETPKLDKIPKNEMKFKHSLLSYGGNYPSYVDRVLLGSNLKSPELIKII